MAVLTSDIDALKRRCPCVMFLGTPMHGTTKKRLETLSRSFIKATLYVNYSQPFH